MGGHIFKVTRDTGFQFNVNLSVQNRKYKATQVTFSRPRLNWVHAGPHWLVLPVQMKNISLITKEEWLLRNNKFS